MNIKPGKLRTVQAALDKLHYHEPITRKEYHELCALHSELQDALNEIEDMRYRCEENCLGEAHSNAFIDNCMLCDNCSESIKSAYGDPDECEVCHAVDGADIYMGQSSARGKRLCTTCYKQESRKEEDMP